MNIWITIERLKSIIHVFLTALTMALLLAACTSSGYDSGGSSSSGGGGNGCNSGYCNSNGLCCPQGYVGCNGSCYTSPSAAYSATLNSSCLSATTVC